MNYHLKPGKYTRTVFQKIVDGFCYISLKITEMRLAGHCGTLMSTDEQDNIYNWINYSG